MTQNDRTKHRWHRRRRATQTQELHLELERLTQENMRLRLEGQRPQNISALAAKLRAAAVTPAAGPVDEDGIDDAYHVMAQTEAMRQAVLEVLDGLLVAAGQMQRQLAHGIPLMEIDRRVLDRRDLRPEPLDVSAR